MDEHISRQAAIDALDQIFDRCEEIEAHLPEGDPDRIGYKMFPDYITVWKYLHQLPSAQPERKKGKWVGYNADDPVWQRDDGTPVLLECSACQAFVINNGAANWNYCPNCGAKMEEGEDNERA